MKLIKTTSALVIATTLAMPSFARDLPQIYGLANLSAQASNDGEGTYSELKSNSSRIGIQGKQNVKHDLTIIYKVEVAAHMDDTKKDTFTARNQYLGFKSSLGTFLIGKNDTILKQSQGSIDQFILLDGDITTLWKGVGETRANDSITYKTPVINNVQFGLTYITEGSKDGDKGQSAGIVYGDRNLNKTSLYAAIAIDNDVKGNDTTRVSLATKVAGVELGTMFQTNEDIESGLEMDGYLVSAAYDINDYTIKAQVQTADFSDGDDQTGVSIGLDYRLAKNAKIYGFYTSFDMDSQEDKDYTAIGLEFKF